jgi:hypothetical protein
MNAWFHNQDWGEVVWLVIVPVAVIVGMVLAGVFNDLLRR